MDMNTYKIIIPTLISIFFVGCGGGSKFPVASQKLHNSAIQSKPPSGKSNIYLFSTDLGERWPQTILLDSQNWGQVSGYKYLFAQVIPGKHSISITGEPSMPVQSRPVVFQTEVDKNYFFNINKNLISIRIEQIEESKGRMYMKKSLPSGINVFDR
jgi:hypothetical protein